MADILAAMEVAAAEERERLLAAARQDAERLVAAARDDVVAARSRAMAQARAAVEAARARLEAQARLAIATKRALARDALVGQAFAMAREALEQVRTSPDYPRILRALVVEALGRFPSGEPLRIRCDPRDAHPLADVVSPAERNLSLETSLACWGGIVVQDSDGRVVADNTLERRLERARQVLWAEVAAMLLSSEASDSARPGETGLAHSRPPTHPARPMGQGRDV